MTPLAIVAVPGVPRSRELGRLVFALAWRFLLRRRTVSGVRSGLRGAVLGIALSLVPLTVVMVVADGLIDGIVDRYLELSSYHAQVAILDSQLTTDASLGVVAEFVGTLSGVEVAIAERRGSALLAAGGQRVVAELRAIPVSLPQMDSGFSATVELQAGAFDLRGSAVVLSAELARQLRVEIGDELQVVAVRSPTAAAGPGTARIVGPPRVTAVRVTGVFSSGYQELDRRWAFVSLSTAAHALPDARELVGIKVADPHDAAALAAVVSRVQRLVGQLGQVRDWKVLERATLRSFETSRVLLMFVVAMIVVIATVNVASATVSISLTRRQEVAYLKAMGLPSAAVFASLTLAGTFAGVTGAILGVAVGLAAAVNINEALALVERAVSWVTDLVAGVGQAPAPVALIDRSFYLEFIPFTLPAEQVAVVAASTVALATLAAAIPALAAARLHPLAALSRTA